MDVILPNQHSAEAAAWVFAFLLGVLLSCRVWRRSNTNNNTKKLPQPSGSWPFIGHLPLLGKLPHINLGKLADEYGPIFMIKIGVNRALVVSSAEIAKECLRTNDKAFATRPHTLFVEHLAYNCAMFGLGPCSPYWRELRKITTVELLSNHRIEMLKDVRISEVRSAIRRISAAESNEIIDMKHWFNDVSMNTVVRLIAGKSLKEFYQGEEYNQCAKALRDFFELAGAFVPADALPLLKWFDIGGYEKRMKKVAKQIDDMAEKWLEEHKRRKGFKEEQEKQDFMDILLQIFEAGQENSFGFDADTIIKANCMVMILGGSDTTAVTLTWALSLLINNKAALRKAQTEIDNIVGKERRVEEADLGKLVYLQAILKETMRLYPAGPLMFREACEDCRVNGFHIPSGTHLIVNLSKIQRDPQLWEDPLEFRPERFFTTHIDSDVRGQHFELIPFGSGRRICPGISLSLQMMQLTLANLLHAFDVSTPSDRAIDMTDGFGLSNLKATPLEVILKPRFSNHVYNQPATAGC